ncbi:digestive organ expansion factor [Roridomyces roridus]|uniref:U3 small nucleolar RNA-associated protein 25 n=1 Tax=Roridomyces roridus TaxID=1738132 RepID=A0AAD7CEH9_9AGAR|nr:digestive organ expansion factor [Roridomyces roridus]
MTDANSTTTRLLTLLNVSATKAGKRKWTAVDGFPTEKLNKRTKSVGFAATAEVTEIIVDATADSIDVDPPEAEGEDEEGASGSNAYESHFGPAPALLSASSRAAVDNNTWTTTRTIRGKLGAAVELVPEGSQPGTSSDTALLERLRTPFKKRQAKQPREQTELQNDLLSLLSSHRDVYLPSTPWEHKKSMREAISLHAINHVTRKRRRVLKNNERLAKADPKASPLEDVQDQGFTRPSVLILLPFRSSALDWFTALTSHTPPPDFQVENQSRFMAEYGLSPGMVDKLTTAEPGTYPRDQVETFKGNVDDNFRVGIKLTRKSIKMFSEFYGCDIIMASPLGLRRSIEKEKSADYLSSIELLVIDQLEALTMQNWEHVKFVLSHLNKLPKDSHDADFSRIKPWYLDGHAEYLRQSILLSALETPETRSLFNSGLKNIAGKVRAEKRWSPVQVPDGIDQNLMHFDCPNPKDEPDKRFNYFTTQVLPLVLRSAVQSSSTAVYVPSSFDFIRVQNYFKKHSGVSFAVLSEYSTNQDINRAREAFFSGKKAFLLISERFHFYKRYKIRGIRNFIFYGPPENPGFYTELLACPFLDDGVEASDVTCRVLYCKYDWFRMERLVGTEAAVELIKAA